MKINVKQFKKISLVLIILGIFNIKTVFASNISFKESELTEEYKKYMQLTEEEKKNVLIPRKYVIKDSFEEEKNNNVFQNLKLVKANLSSRYSLQNEIPNNLKIRNQMQTNTCWAFATLSSLETNLALKNHKKGIDDKIFDFSERHMEYATSREFKDGKINKDGYNRKVGDGGSYYLSTSYFTNGQGVIDEIDMPFENNNDIIDISNIQNKKITAEVLQTIEFPDYQLNENVIDNIKEHIQNYGSVYAGLHGGSIDPIYGECYDEHTAAKYCENSINHQMDHAVSIVGWDDNYSKSNFVEGHQPKNNGAWIVRNSWGERQEIDLSELKKIIFSTEKEYCEQNNWTSPEMIPNEEIIKHGTNIDEEKNIAYKNYGDKGFIYVSYEDASISKTIFGIVKAMDVKDYDNKYQYDKYYPAMQIQFEGNEIYLVTKFNKKQSTKEYLNKISLFSPSTYTYEVYVNPSNSDFEISNLKKVNLKTGNNYTCARGYNTIEFEKPIELTGDSYAICVKVLSKNDLIDFALESVFEKPFDVVEIENNTCFVGVNDGKNNIEWVDTSNIKQLDSQLYDGDLTIKAYTTNQLYDESLKNIEIKTPPIKTNYFVGENFDKTGMEIQANYNSKINPYKILKDNDYSIINATSLKEGQDFITITYKDKTIKQPIKVEKNSVIKLSINNPPNKVDYLEGDDIDYTGMKIEAEYKDGTIKEITDYKVKDGKNIFGYQTSFTIIYGDKEVEQKINVTKNPLVELNIIKEPNKLKYVEGQDFNREGMLIQAVYENGNKKEIENYQIENVLNLTKDQKEINIKYDTKEIKLPITVEEKKVVQISIKAKPNKLEYVQNTEELDLTGGILLVKYNDDSSEEISLENNDVKILGFDNSKVGDNTIEVTYLNEKTNFVVKILKEPQPENSIFNSSKLSYENIKLYIYTDEKKESYTTFNAIINNIKTNTVNDRCEYYYAFNTKDSDSDIKNWIKIDSNINEGKLKFNVNTKELDNSVDLINSEVVYLFIKEVAIKANNQKVCIQSYKANATIEDADVYIDDELIEGNIEDNNSNNDVDNTTAPDKIPQTGAITISATVAVIAIAGIIFYIKYKKVNKYIK